MQLNLLSKINNVTYNLKLAKCFGVNSAIYISLILDQEVICNTQDVKLSREDIYNLSGIDETKQIETEENLLSYGLITLDKVRYTNKNSYILNSDLLYDILTKKEEDLEQTLNSLYIPKKSPEKTKISKKQAILNNLKSNIRTEDEEAKQSLDDWIQAIYDKNSYLTKQSVVYMEDELLKYAKKDLIKFRCLCKIASRVAYKDPKWVIVKYKEEYQSNNLKLNDLQQTDIDTNIEQLKNYKGETF